MNEKKNVIPDKMIISKKNQGKTIKDETGRCGCFRGWSVTAAVCSATTP